MPFMPCHEHLVLHGNGLGPTATCEHCGRTDIPFEALTGNVGYRKAYSHPFDDGRIAFSQTPIGRYEPCHSAKSH